MTDSNFVGQKLEEILYYEEEITKINENDDIVSIEFISSFPVQKLLNQFDSFENYMTNIKLTKDGLHSKIIQNLDKIIKRV